MLIGALTSTTNRATWQEDLEFVDATDDSLIDFSVAEEITLTVRDPDTHDDVLVLKKTTGGITTPSAGIIHIRAEKAQMESLRPKTYMVALDFLDDGDTVSLVLGTLPVLGWEV